MEADYCEFRFSPRGPEPATLIWVRLRTPNEVKPPFGVVKDVTCIKDVTCSSVVDGGKVSLDCKCCLRVLTVDPHHAVRQSMPLSKAQLANPILFLSICPACPFTLSVSRPYGPSLLLAVGLLISHSLGPFQEFLNYSCFPFHVSLSFSLSFSRIFNHSGFPV